ncbi:MAG: tetracycline resistance efflux pump [Phycisphaerales bacterium]|nr:tetracycline resistance efflux pump [Phycisphaerales bacterium]
MSQTAASNEESALPVEPPKGALLSIFLIVLVDFLGFGLIIPLLPFYIPDYENNPLKVTLLFSVYSICQFIGAPILGALSDRYGRRPILIFSQIGSAAGYILLGVASVGTWDPHTRLMLVYLSRIIDGFTGGNVSTAQAYISDVTTRENRAKGMGLLGAAFGIGFCLGPFLGGVLGGINVSWPAYAAAIFATIAAAQTYFKLPESRVHKPTESKLWLHPSNFTPVLKKPVVFQILLISFASMAAFVMMEATVGIFLAKIYRWTDPKIAAQKTGWFFGYVGLIIVLVQGGMIGRLTKRVGEWPLAIIGPILVAVGMGFYIGMAWWPALLVLGLAGAFNATGRSLQGPTLSSLLSKYSNPDEQGVVFGLYHGLSSLARVAGPIIAGLTYPYWHNTGHFWTSGIIVLVVAVWTIAVKAQARRYRLAPEAGGPAFEVIQREEAVGRAATTEIE